MRVEPADWMVQRGLPRYEMKVAEVGEESYWLSEGVAWTVTDGVALLLKFARWGVKNMTTET